MRKGPRKRGSVVEKGNRRRGEGAIGFFLARNIAIHGLSFSSPTWPLVMEGRQDGAETTLRQDGGGQLSTFRRDILSSVALNNNKRERYETTCPYRPARCRGTRGKVRMEGRSETFNDQLR